MTIETQSNTFKQTLTAPISRSASGVSIDVANVRITELMEKLEDAYREAKEECLTDSENILPSEALFKQAQSFAMSLSLHPFSLPLVMCLNDGGICFQWSNKQKGILTATIYGDNAIVHVARFGPKERSTGTDEYQNEIISESLLVWLKKYFMPSSKQPWMNTSTTMSH